MALQQKELEDLQAIQASIQGLADIEIDLCKPGRRLVMREELFKQKKKGGSVKNPNIVFLFNDLMVFTERTSKKSFTLKYSSHFHIKDIFLIDNDTKDKFSFSILHQTEKKKHIFSVRTHDQKVNWVTHIQQELEKMAPVDETCDITSPCSPRIASWHGSMLDLMAFPGSLGSHSDLESEGASTDCDSPSSRQYLLGGSTGADWSSAGSDNDSTSMDDATDDSTERSDEEYESNECRIIKQADGVEIISHANLHTTLWWLINYGDYNDPVLIRTFLYSCIHLTTPTDLFENLMNIYNLVIPVPKEITLRYSLCDTRKRVTYFLRIWLEHFFERDFFQNRALFDNLTGFFQELNNDNRKQDANMLKLVILRVNKKRLSDMGMNRFSLMQPTAQPVLAASGRLSSRYKNKSGQHSPLAMSNTPMPSEQKFLDWNVTAVAEQFGLIEFALFKTVEMKELSNMAWKSEQPRKTAPNVVNIFNRFDLVSQWAATEVVMAQSTKQRVIIIEKLIQLAQKCLELRNFNSLMEIIAGLNRGSVQRMKKAWEAVAHVSKDTFRSLNSVVDSLQNYKNYRELLKRSPLPCLPYFGIFLRDLTFTDVGNQSKIGESINFEKIYMTSRILKEIQTFQRTPYAIEEDETLQPLLKRLLAMPEEMLYKHSQSIEPSMNSMVSSTEKFNI